MGHVGYLAINNRRDLAHLGAKMALTTELTTYEYDGHSECATVDRFWRDPIHGDLP